MVTPLALLPGMGCSTALWSDIPDRLYAAYPDLRIVTPQLTKTALDDCVDDLLERLPERCAVAGLSLGGIVAMALARRAPERLTGLCLMSTNPQAPTHAQREGWVTQRARLAAGEHAEDLQRDLLPLLVSDAVDDRTRDAVVAMAGMVGDSGFDAQLALQATRVDERSSLQHFAAPALVISAERDALCPPSWHEDMAARLPQGHLVRIPRAGHLSPMEAPAEVAHAVLAWLERIADDR